MFEYAAELGEADLARELGEACIAAAPPDVPSGGLADEYHLLAVTYSLLDRVADAVTAYRQAISCTSGPSREAERPARFTWNWGCWRWMPAVTRTPAETWRA